MAHTDAQASEAQSPASKSPEKATLLGTLGTRLNGAVRAYNETVGSYEARVLPGARRFADHGYLAAAPDFLSDGWFLGCIMRAARDLRAGSGPRESAPGRQVRVRTRRQ